MGKGRPVLFVIVGIGGLGLIIYLLYLAGQGNIWVERYSLRGEEPYDLKVFNVLLDEAVDEKSEFLYTSIYDLDEDTTQKTLIFTGHNLYADSAEASGIIEFIERGNTVFIIAPRISYFILESLDSTEYFGYIDSYENTSVDVVLDESDTTQHYTFEYRYKSEKTLRYWVHFEDSLYEWSNVVALSHYTDSLSSYRTDNFRQVQIGKGNLLIHTDPLLFTNLYIIEKSGFEYANKVIGYLPNQPIIWDQYHQIYREEKQNASSKTPLRFVMQHPALKYAWYTLIVSALLFVVFRSKRQQKIIPLIPRIENTSIAFAKSLGALLYQADSGRYLAAEQMKLFNNYIRRKFGIKRKKDNKGLAVEIAKKSKVPIDLIETILTLERKIVFNPSSKMRDNLALYQKLNEYYKLAKK